jgi:hypothetical protein
MGVRVRHRSAGWRSVCLTLTLLALAFKVLVPQGLMLSEQGPGIPLVICTGHGPLTLSDDGHGGSKDPAQKKSDAPCMGAGNVTPVTPLTLAVVSEPIVLVADSPHSGKTLDLIPGRGLAAPPPQSHAPPAVSI